jgi:hypothetical protein
MENIQTQDMMMERDVTPKFLNNPSLQDLETQLERERNKLMHMSFNSEDERHKTISRIRMLRSSIDMLQGYLQHFALN